MTYGDNYGDYMEFMANKRFILGDSMHGSFCELEDGGNYIIIHLNKD
ncbi:MAG: hypothetical protein KJ767_00175 [Nanoarchaeota archaeon]|nr:hypothetical protein [Nanoarchaeota archaeon]